MNRVNNIGCVVPEEIATAARSAVTESMRNAGADVIARCSERDLDDVLTLAEDVYVAMCIADAPEAAFLRARIAEMPLEERAAAWARAVAASGLQSPAEPSSRV